MTQYQLPSPTSLTRLCKALNIEPDFCTSIQIEVEAGEFRMTVTRMLTLTEVNSLAKYFETENLEMIPLGETTYNLQKRCEQTTEPEADIHTSLNPPD